MECIIAKIFGSEAQKEAAIELFMKTHGGRSFLHGHLFGDNVHEFLAPCIYEGEGEMLGMAFFKSLVKEHGKQFFEPIGKALAAAGHQEAEPAQPGPRLGAAKGRCGPYAKWLVGQKLRRHGAARTARGMPHELARARRVRRRVAAASAGWRSAARCASTSSSWPTASAAWPSCRSACRTLVVDPLHEPVCARGQTTRWSGRPPTSSART